MAYKFQFGSATMSGSLVQEGDLYVSASNQVLGEGTKDLYLQGHFYPVDDDSTDLGSSSKEFKDLYLDGVAYIDTLNAGALGANLDCANYNMTNVDIDSGAIDGTVIGAASVAAGSFAAVAGTTGTFSGILKSDDTTEATTTTNGSLQTDGGLSVAKSAVIGDDLDLLSDAAIMNFGADKDVNLTHVADTGLLLNSSRQLQFGDSGTYIYQEADGTLEVVADGQIALNAPTVDLPTDNAVVKFGDDSDVTLTHVHDTGLLLNSTRQLQFGDSGTYIHQSADGVLDLVSDTEIEINATTVDINGAIAAAGAITVGADDSGYDVKFWGDTASAYMLWDTSADDLILAGTAGLVVPDGKLTLNATAVTSTATELNALDGWGSAVYDASADSVAFLDATDSKLKYEAADDFVSAIAGKGMDHSSGKLVLSINNLDAAAVDVANDSIAILDANDSSASKKESIADLVAGIAGDGLNASSGVLSVSGAGDSMSISGIGNADATLAAGMNVGNVTLTASRSWTLPSSPSNGDVVYCKAPGNLGGYVIKVKCNASTSHQIDNGESEMQLETANAALALVYIGSNVWSLF